MSALQSTADDVRFEVTAHDVVEEAVRSASQSRSTSPVRGHTDEAAPVSVHAEAAGEIVSVVVRAASIRSASPPIHDDRGPDEGVPVAKDPPEPVKDSPETPVVETPPAPVKEPMTRLEASRLIQRCGRGRMTRHYDVWSTWKTYHSLHTAYTVQAILRAFVASKRAHAAKCRQVQVRIRRYCQAAVSMRRVKILAYIRQFSACIGRAAHGWIARHRVSVKWHARNKARCLAALRRIEDAEATQREKEGQAQHFALREILNLRQRDLNAIRRAQMIFRTELQHLEDEEAIVRRQVEDDYAFEVSGHFRAHRTRRSRIARNALQQATPDESATPRTRRHPELPAAAKKRQVTVGSVVVPVDAGPSNRQLVPSTTLHDFAMPPMMLFVEEYERDLQRLRGQLEARRAVLQRSLGTITLQRDECRLFVAAQNPTAVQASGPAGKAWLPASAPRRPAKGQKHGLGWIDETKMRKGKHNLTLPSIHKKASGDPQLPFDLV